LSNDAKKSKVDSDLANRLDTLFDEDDKGENPLPVMAIPKIHWMS
jgi:hypothetical protein